MDWNEIKTEYITTDTSYRKLADKYDVSRVAIAARGKDEGWVGLKEQFLADTLSKTLKDTAKKQSERMARILTVSDKFLKIIEDTVKQIEPEQVVLNPQTIKQLVGAIKDLKDIQNLKSEIDLREQNARIKNLEKQANSGDTPQSITVTIAGGEDSWAK